LGSAEIAEVRRLLHSERIVDVQMEWPRQKASQITDPDWIVVKLQILRKFSPDVPAIRLSAGRAGAHVLEGYVNG